MMEGSFNFHSEAGNIKESGALFDLNVMMRRSINAPTLHTQTSEPLIVVEDSNYEGEEDEKTGEPECYQSSEEESPTMNPYLLSPYSREIRKHSLPTPQCSGITASQVRRLSERGETTGPGPRQAEFLATLSTAPQPTPGGRRHSVVTISRVPPSLFGRNRRESVAAFPSFPTRILPNRRESIACPPSTEPRGSVHNLQLDIMDDIVQARKVRMKLWNTSNEKVCEVQPLDETSSENVQRYTNSSARRYSDFVGTTLAPIPSSTKRRASELPPISTPCTSTSASKPPTTGIVCSNNDLISILSLSISSTEINQCEGKQQQQQLLKQESFDATKNTTAEQKRSRLKSNRSNSFDISILHTIDQIKPNEKPTQSPSNWLLKRHQPLSQSNKIQTDKTIKSILKNKKPTDTEPGKVVWDERSTVDAHALGSAIEVFLRQTSPDGSSTGQTSPNHSPNKNKAKNSTAGRSKISWFSSKTDDSTETCDSSICSTLKDLFVK